MSSEHAGGTPGPGAMSERMRALLSRAAEEQLHEQRQVSTVLGELRALVADLDERLATGEQVDRVAAELQALSDRVDTQLDATQARSAELAERITDATALVGQAAEDLAEAVAARVTERLEASLRGLMASVGEQLATTERRLAVHVDDAVIALAEVVLRRGRPAPPEAASPPAPAVAAAVTPDVPLDAPVTEPDVQHADTEPDPDDTEPDPDDTTELEGAAEPEAPEAARADAPPPDAPPVGHQDPLDVHLDVAAAEAPADRPVGTGPGDGFVLVPADVAVADAAPAPLVEQERRTTDRRAAGRDDGSGRRLLPWWRQV